MVLHKWEGRLGRTWPGGHALDHAGARGVDLGPVLLDEIEHLGDQAVKLGQRRLPIDRQDRLDAPGWCS